MTLDTDLELLRRQEQSLTFTQFTEADAWALGTLMRNAALEQKLPLVIDIRVGQKPLFYVALPGTTPENPDWVRRKVNTVYRFEASSYRVALANKAKGEAFDASRGIDPLTYAAAGGGFPIRIGGLVVGAVTVSGIPQRQDHGFVVQCLCQFLDKDYDALKLGEPA